MEGKEQENETKESSLDEYENMFSKIDSELDALRSSINDDDGGGGGDDGKSAPLVSPYKKTESVKDKDGNLDNDQTNEPSHPNSKSETMSSTTRLPFIVVSIFVVVLAVLYAKKPSNPVDNIVESNLAAPGKGNVVFKESRKVERCRYVNGEKNCESDEASRSSSSSSGNTGGVYQHATFQKCRYVNGQSYCESYEKTLSNNGNENSKFTRQQLMAEFRAADIDKDGQVSQAEFEAYKKRYLQIHPDMKNSFASFKDFDPDNSGLITVQEHEQYYKSRGLL